MQQAISENPSNVKPQSGFGSWARFRLRSMLLLILIFSMGLAWVANERRKNAEQIADLISLKKSCYNYYFTESKLPVWWQKLLGMNPSGDLISISFYLNANCTTEELEKIGKFHRLRYLSLSFNPVSDRDLKHLKCLTQLKFLNLDKSAITNEGLDHLVGLKNLELLSLSGTKIDDSAMEYLNNWPNLKELRVADTSISDLGMERISKLPQLMAIDIRNTTVTNKGAQYFTEMPKLTGLWFDGTQITHSDLERLGFDYLDGGIHRR
jgi:Leucine Rich repeat